MQHLFN